MQLEDNGANKVNVKAALSLATCALLGSDSADAQEPLGQSLASPTPWSFDTAVLLYTEADRVSALEAMISANKEFDDEHFLTLKLTIDTLTGASASGAVEQPQVQTFTRPSGNGQYQIAAGTTPLDDTFHDTRVQLNGQWTQPIGKDLAASIGAHLSKEFDYLSLGLNVNVSYDFNLKNTTASAGFSHFKDTFSPIGEIPKPFASMLIGNSDDPTWDNEFADTRLIDEDDKSTTDILLGLTQVINRRMITQFNYSYSMVDGYLTDPFKVLSVLNNQGISQDFVYESRPSERTKHSLFAQSKYHFESTILDVSYRYMWDDWQIKSHTVDTRWRFNLQGSHYIEPHIRFYDQSAAEFYQPFLLHGKTQPAFASADYRIGEMNAYTLGVKYGLGLNHDEKLAFRLEYYSQQPKNSGFEQPVSLADFDLYEGVDAVILQVSYSF